MSAKKPCPENGEHTTIKGCSMLCYSHCKKGQIEAEAVSSESPWSAPFVIFSNACARKVSSLSCRTTWSWLPGHHPSQASTCCPLLEIVMISMSALFMTYYPLHPKEKGRQDQQGGSNISSWRVCVWGRIKDDLPVVCAAAFSKHFELDLIFTWFWETCRYGSSHFKDLSSSTQRGVGLYVRLEGLKARFSRLLIRTLPLPSTFLISSLSPFFTLHSTFNPAANISWK